VIEENKSKASAAAVRILEIEARRTERKKASDDKRDAQHVVDLEAIEELEIALGEGSVAIVEIPEFTPGCVTLVAARSPNSAEVKRYRYMASDKPGKRNEVIPGDAVGAAEQLAETCLKYPDAEAFEKVCSERPGLKAQLGTFAVQLVLGKAKS
jgi:hypothetical protein